MFGSIARRLGFEQSVPVSLVNTWHIPSLSRPPIEVAPRGGASSCLVDQFGRLQPLGESWAVELCFAGGVRWVPASQIERLAQKVDEPGVVETVFQTPAGPLTQRVAAGIVDGQPAAIVEVENTGGVAVAIGMVIRPIGVEGRGHIRQADVTGQAVVLDDRPAVLFSTPPSAVRAIEGKQGDLLVDLPEATDSTSTASAECRSGGAQVAAVWPLPHTATLRIVVPLDQAPSTTASVPTTADIQRGWTAHLKHGMRVEVDELPVAEQLAGATRGALTLWPERADAPLAVLALSEAGFGRDVSRIFTELERCEEDDRVMRALARWAQLGDATQQLTDAESILGRAARGAHVVANSGGELPGEPWLAPALVALGGRFHQIDQADVAERIQSFRVREQSATNRADQLGALTKQLDKRGAWRENPMASACSYIRAIRSVVIEDAADELRLFPEVPLAWRGRAIDVFNVPVAGGTLSCGLRWHGPRPALLWEASLAPETPFRLRVPGIDPAFETTELQGEVLLGDPGWSKGKKKG